MGRLGILWLHGNRLTGEIPPELGDLTRLRYLGLDHNQLSGQIPAELGDLYRLVFIRLSANQFTGCVPAGLQGVPFNDFKSLGLPFCGP